MFNEYEKQKNFNFNRGWTDYYNVLNIEVDLKIEYAWEYATLDEFVIFENNYFVEFIWMYTLKDQDLCMRKYLDQWTLLSLRPFVYPKQQFSATTKSVKRELERAEFKRDIQNKTEEAHYFKLKGTMDPDDHFNPLLKVWIATDTLPSLSFREFDECLH